MIPALTSRSTSASPIAAAVVTCPDVAGRSSWARHSADSASIFAVSVYPGSPPATSVTTRLPPPSPTNFTLNQLRARRSSDGPSPGVRSRSRRLRVGGSAARASRAPEPAAIPAAVASRLTAT